MSTRSSEEPAIDFDSSKRQKNLSSTGVPSLLEPRLETSKSAQIYQSKLQLPPKQLFAQNKGSEVNVLVLGASRTGKSTLLRSWIGNEQGNLPYQATREEKYLKREAEDILVSYRDTGGDKNLWKDHLVSWVHEAHAFMFVFDPRDRDSFERLQCLPPLVLWKLRKCPKMIVSNLPSATTQAGLTRVSQVEMKDLASMLGEGTIIESVAESEDVSKTFGKFVSLLKERIVNLPVHGSSARLRGIQHFASDIVGTTMPVSSSPRKKNESSFRRKEVKRPTFPVQKTTPGVDTQPSTPTEKIYSPMSMQKTSTPPTTKTKTSSPPEPITVLMAGSSGVGKTHILNWRLKKRSDEQEYDATVEDTYTLTEETKQGEHIMVNILDTGGDAGCDEFMPEWIKQCQGCMLVINTEEPVSVTKVAAYFSAYCFLDLNDCVKQAERLAVQLGKRPVLLVANSPTSDPDRRRVSADSVQDLAQRIKAPHVETCTSTGSGVAEAFLLMTEIICGQQQASHAFKSQSIELDSSNQIEQSSPVPMQKTQTPISMQKTSTPTATKKKTSLPPEPITVLMAGSSGVGKTHILNWRLKRRWDEQEYDATVEDTYTLTEETKQGEHIMVNILDTGGDAGCDEFMPEWIKQCQGCMLVINTEEPVSVTKVAAYFSAYCFLDLNDCVKQAERLAVQLGKRPVLLVANSPTSDPDRRRVSADSVQDLAQRIKAPHVETCTSTGSGVAEAFLLMTEIICGQQQASHAFKSQSIELDSSNQIEQSSPVPMQKTQTPISMQKTSTPTATKTKTSSPPEPITVLMAGSSGVGKTHILNWRLKKRSDEQEYDATVEDTYTLTEETKQGEHIMVNILDTGGDAGCDEFMPEWIKQCQGCMLVINTEEPVSVTKAERLAVQLGKRPVLLVANSPTSDPDRRKVSADSVQDLAQRIKAPHVETCTSTGSGVAEAFSAITHKLDLAQRIKAPHVETCTSTGSGVAEAFSAITHKFAEEIETWNLYFCLVIASGQSLPVLGPVKAAKTRESLGFCFIAETSLSLTPSASKAVVKAT
eukprot:g76185.t1